MSLIHAAVSMAVTRSSDFVVAAPCIRRNNTLSGPLSGFLNKIGGAFGDLVFVLPPIIMGILAVLAILTILSDRASGFIKAIILVALIAPGVILLMVIINALLGGMNNYC